MKLHVIFSHFIINNTFNSSFNQTPFNCFLVNNNFICSFNQTHIFTQPTQLKVIFLNLRFSNHNRKIYCNVKHTLKQCMIFSIL